jgi:hypothetical protein
VILITGPGRSGTSVLAALYQELGYSPGGYWTAGVSAGLEASDVVEVNDAIARDLDMTMTGPARKARRLHAPPGTARIVERLDLYRRFETLPGRRARDLTLLDWERFDEVVSARGEQLRTLASEKLIVKDPRFCFTLPVWLAAGAAVTHVVIATRDVDAMLKSRQVNRLISFSSTTDAKNSLIYAIGSCLATCWDHRVPHTILRYPDFLWEVPSLHRELPLLQDLDYEQFEAATSKVFREDLVHH